MTRFAELYHEKGFQVTLLNSWRQVRGSLNDLITWHLTKSSTKGIWTAGRPRFRGDVPRREVWT